MKICLSEKCVLRNLRFCIVTLTTVFDKNYNNNNNNSI